ncbi:putative KilA-N domain-containing protein [Megavirus vitis]|nr:putative KilA-N domain-containing protein [Megavirus vitis]
MSSKTKKIIKSKSKYSDRSDISSNSSEISDYELSDYEQRKVVRKSNKTKKTNNKPLKRYGSKRFIIESASSESEGTDSSEDNVKSISNKKQYLKRKSSKKILDSESEEDMSDINISNESDNDKPKDNFENIIESKENDFRNIIFENINEKFAVGKFGDFEVIINRDNGYINATQLCKDCGERFSNWKRNDKSNELINALLKQLNSRAQNRVAENSRTQKRAAEKIDESKIIMEIKGGKLIKIRGTYVHPKLIINIASWCSTEYSLKVSDIMMEYHTKEAVEEKEKLLKKKDDKIDKLRNDIKRLMEQGNEVLGYAKDTNRKINVVVNERVPMSDKPKNEESFYIVKNNDKVKPGKSKTKKKIYGYKAIRITNKSKSSTMSKYYKDHPKGEIILKIKYTPNAKHLWNACKDKIYIEDENITPGNNAFCYFNLCDGYSEKKLKKDIMKIHNNRLNHSDV